MHSPTNYLIFWLPPGNSFDNPAVDSGYANASDANYQALVERYFRDVSSTEYYYILQQYTDSSGAPGTRTTFGGSWVDVSPYPNSEGSKTNPLQDSDLANEVARAIAVKGWSAGNGNNEFFVFTGYDVYGCAGTICSYNGYCAYHSAYTDANGQDVIYAVVPDPGNKDAGSCLATDATGLQAPNGGAFADSAVNLTAHEEFESVTDPIFNGWYYQDTNHEIGDECVWMFGSVAGDGSDITLNGHKYLVQEMWSNEVDGCFLPSVTILQVMASYDVLDGGSGFTAPTLTFFAYGVLQNKPLSDIPQTLTIDYGSPWNVTGTLAGSSSDQRWQTSQATTGVANGGAMEFTYYHQFLIAFRYDVTGGGAGYSAPALTVAQFGSSMSVAATKTGSNVWVDAQSTYTSPSQLQGSTSSERWLSRNAAGSISSSMNVSLTYYHQYLVPVSYSLSGGGGIASSPPLLTYASLGEALNITLGLQPQSVWLDAGAEYSAADPLSGSTTTERLFSPSGSGNVYSTAPLVLGYYDQYFLSVEGSTAQSAWYNSSTQAAITAMGVYARSLGAGLRITGYEIDGGALQRVAPTTGLVSVAVQMNQPHVLLFTTVTQYQVSLDPGASAALDSLTPPTVAGDNYWYDSGSNVTLVLNGAWGRGSSSGNRLVSYTVDGGTAVSLDTDGSVTVLRSLRITSPRSVTAATVAQYQLLTRGGSVQSVTNPPVPGDAGWYDSGTVVNLSYDYEWNVTQASRLSALAIKLDGIESQIQRSGIGTFQETVTMDSAHTLDVISVTQYPLVVSGGFEVVASPPSPTEDSFYDAGSSVSVSSAHTWNSTATAREALVSYSLDGGSASEIPNDDAGTFTTLLTFDGPHQLVFLSAKQYLVTFRVTDASGVAAVVPTLLEIDTTQPNGTVDIHNSSAWLEAGSSFVVGELLWEKTDVKPPEQTVLVDAPRNVTIAARIYPATIRVTDYLQVPVSGATVNMEFVNGTLKTRTTASDGTISITSVPLGRLNGTVSYLGFSQEIGVAGPQNSPIGVRFLVSGPDFGASGGAVALAMMGYAVVRRRRGR